jgi:anti-anti-sigma regulatory factor
LTLRIYRSSTPDAIVFTLSGDMDLEHVARLQELLANETLNRVILDLKEVTFADRAAVQFLASAEAVGIRIVNCPRYVRSWITAETESQPQRIDEQDCQGKD